MSGTAGSAAAAMLGLGLAIAALWSEPAAAQGVINGGFLGSYAPGTAGVTDPAFQRRDVRLDFNWTTVGPGGSPSPSFATAGWSGFSARWEGQIVPATTETYQFILAAGDSANLLIRPVGNASWTTLAPISSGATTSQASMALIAGQAYEIRINYIQHAATGSLSLSWQSPSIPKQIIEPATPIGINAPALMPGEPGNMLADVLKEANGFGHYSSTVKTITYDQNGWPTTDTTLTPLERWPRGRGNLCHQLHRAGPTHRLGRHRQLCRQRQVLWNNPAGRGRLQRGDQHDDCAMAGHRHDRGCGHDRLRPDAPDGVLCRRHRHYRCAYPAARSSRVLPKAMRRAPCSACSSRISSPPSPASASWITWRPTAAT
ncbi:MAG: PA14 domain-containing protein [Aliidongia sp.]